MVMVMFEIPLPPAPAPAPFYGQHRAAGDLYHQALRALGNCGSPEIVEGFLCRFGFGLFP